MQTQAIKIWWQLQKGTDVLLCLVTTHTHTHTENTHTQSPCTAEDHVVRLTANKKVEREWDDG